VPIAYVTFACLLTHPSDGVKFSFWPKLGGMFGQVPLTSKIARIKSFVARLVCRGATRCGHRGLDCY